MGSHLRGAVAPEGNVFDAWLASAGHVARISQGAQAHLALGVNIVIPAAADVAPDRRCLLTGGDAHVGLAASIHDRLAQKSGAAALALDNHSADVAALFDDVAKTRVIEQRNPIFEEQAFELVQVGDGIVAGAEAALLALFQVTAALPAGRYRLKTYLRNRRLAFH